MSAIARNVVCTAIPPTALLTASEASPFHVADTDMIEPDSDVTAPIKIAPVSRSPRPVILAISSARRVSSTPPPPISPAATTKTSRLVVNDSTTIGAPRHVAARAPT